jgi:hypothetical protein
VPYGLIAACNTDAGRENETPITTQPPDLHSLTLDHKSFAVLCPLALIGRAFYPVLVHRLMASIHASSPHSVTLMQLRFTSFAVVSLRRDFHPQDCAHAGRTQKRALAGPFCTQSEITWSARTQWCRRALPSTPSESCGYLVFLVKAQERDAATYVWCTQNQNRRSTNIRNRPGLRLSKRAIAVLPEG